MEMDDGVFLRFCRMCPEMVVDLGQSLVERYREGMVSGSLSLPKQD